MVFGRTRIRFTALLFSSLALAGCGAAPGLNDGGSSGHASQKAEPGYCSNNVGYSGGIAISGLAQFQFRAINPSSGLSATLTSANIPFAEVVVVNSAGTTVQCSNTSATGVISLTIPAGAGSYTLKVRSRSDTAKLKLSVLEDYYENAPYEITKAFTVTSSDTNKNIGTLTATGASNSAKVEGGAFNIYTQIYKVNEYLRAQLGDSSFVAPKVSAYWKKGFNPYTYFGGSTPVSFYRMGTGDLFILGGASGDVASSDTDHYDNSVIVHEYGHFLEDTYAVSDSPGGSHYLNTIIDPRLAWSEGWANFIQAAVLNDGDSSWKYYIDTVGDGTTASSTIAIKFDLTMTNGRCSTDLGSVSCDNMSAAGEGTFREVSISRTLFKTIRATVSGGAGIPFSALWSVFSGGDVSGSPTGFASSQVSFRNIARFNEFLSGIISTTYSANLSDWNAVRANEHQNADSRNYGDTLTRVAENSCAVKTLTPSVESTATNDKSNQLTSNAFYVFDYDGSTSAIRLEYSNRSATSSNYHDLDLILYREDYVYQETGAASTGGVVVSSARAPALDGGVEQISLHGLSAGRYMLNVKAYTLGKTSAQLSATPAMTYRLKAIGTTTEDLCPAH